MTESRYDDDLWEERNSLENIFRDLWEKTSDINRATFNNEIYKLRLSAIIRKKQIDLVEKIKIFDEDLIKRRKNRTLLIAFYFSIISLYTFFMVDGDYDIALFFILIILSFVGLNFQIIIENNNRNSLITSSEIIDCMGPYNLKPIISGINENIVYRYLYGDKNEEDLDKNKLYIYILELRISILQNINKEMEKSADFYK